jgi:hypothetical protein
MTLQEKRELIHRAMVAVLPHHPSLGTDLQRFKETLYNDVFDAMDWMKQHPMCEVKSPGRGYLRYNPHKKPENMIMNGVFEYSRCEDENSGWLEDSTLKWLHNYKGKFQLLETMTIPMPDTSAKANPEKASGDYLRDSMNNNFPNALVTAQEMVTNSTFEYYNKVNSWVYELSKQHDVLNGEFSFATSRTYPHKILGLVDKNGKLVHTCDISHPIEVLINEQSV